MKEVTKNATVAFPSTFYLLSTLDSGINYYTQIGSQRAMFEIAILTNLGAMFKSRPPLARVTKPRFTSLIWVRQRSRG